MMQRGGCGPLGVLDLLSRRGGTTGEVVGVDRAHRMIGFAERSIDALIEAWATIDP